MNKQELIEKFEQFSGHGSRCYIERNEILNLVKQLDETEKVKVPQFVADWIEKCKNNFGFNLKSAMNINTILHYSDDCHKMIDWIKVNSNQETFARAWLDGYEAEEEKRYLVKVKGMLKGFEFLTFKFGHVWIFSNEEEDEEFRLHHTRKQLEEAGFGWVFDCPGIEIEEVER